MGLLEGKTALVTGGSRGIGAAIVRTFVAQGAKVAFTYARSTGPAEALVAELGEQHCKAYRSDAANFDAAAELAKAVTKDFGNYSILVNNAGITRDGLLLRMSEDHWDSVMDNNLKSIFNLTKHSLRPLMKSGAGSVINMSSVVGVTGQAGQANYAASKAGIIGFSKSLAKEMGSRNLRCNVLTPGFIQTDMTDELPDELRDSYLANIPLKRLGRAEEIAKACVFLASDLSSYVNGQVIGVDGGLT